ARAERIVAVVAAVDRHVVVLRRLAGGDDGVVAHLVRGRELDAGQQRDGREVVAVHRRQLAELVGADVAADLRAGRVDQRRLGGDADGLLEPTDGHRDGDRQRLADLQNETAAFEALEAGELRGDPIAPGYEL